MSKKKSNRKVDSISTSALKHRTYFFRIYHDPRSALLNLGGISHYAYIKHDRDTKPDGTLKQSHWHCVVTFNSPRYPNSVADTIRATIPQEERNGHELEISATETKLDPHAIRNAIRYLIHADDPKKVQYDRSEISTDFDDYVDKWLFMSADEKEKSDKEADNAQFIADLIDLTPLEMGFKYGRDYIKNFNSYTFFACLLRDNSCIKSADSIHVHFKAYRGEELSEQDIFALECEKMEQSHIEEPYEYSADGKALLYEKLHELEERNKRLSEQYYMLRRFTDENKAYIGQIKDLKKKGLIL